MINFKDFIKKATGINKIFQKKIVKKIMDKKEEIEKDNDKKNIKTSMAVDIGSSSIKVVQFSKIKGISVLDTFGEIALGPFVGKEIGEPVRVSPEIMAKALDIILDAAGADSLNASYCISPNQSFIFSLPYNEKKAKKDLNDFIIETVEKKYNINIDDYDIDYEEIKDNFKKNKDVTVYEITGIKKEILKYNEGLSKSLNLNIKLERIEIKSVFYAINHFYADDYFIIDIGSRTSKVYIIKQDKVFKYKVFNIGSHQIIKDFNIEDEKDFADNIDGKFIGSTINSVFAKKMAQKVEKKTQSIVLNKLFTDIHDFLKEFEVSHKIFIEKVILTGGGSLFTGLEKYFSESLYRKVTIADPFKKVKNPNFVDQKLKEVGPEYTAAIGLALEALNK